MTDNYLKTARKNGSKVDSTSSEAELIQTHDGLRESYEELHTLRQNISREKMSALADIDAKYMDELKGAEAQYAMMLSLAR